ncbi:MarR family transcriptional regulator [Phenylobacterium sp. J426]|uniref:MarR family winged helix-turn-helix transcriptional regulator n=1 Tax=Phenylobacterium sp. J426 TaxID=2898439 RepID=UPI002150F3EE|nr:MarR family transcriptional regulator [Phenylobacterium sp. J426]MCR5873299.1 MarR family transcriptional regulator [Phenylobacterium sp. J426]
MAAQIEEHPEVQVFDEISMIEHGVRVVIGGCLPVGLSYPQFEVMNLIMRRGGELSPAQIASALQMTPGAITNTLQRLEALRLVAVEPCESDRRKKRVRLTAEGRETYGRSMAAIRPKMEKLREAFTQKEFREALPFLRALRAWMTDQG